MSTASKITAAGVDVRGCYFHLKINKQLTVIEKTSQYATIAAQIFRSTVQLKPLWCMQHTSKRCCGIRKFDTRTHQPMFLKVKFGANGLCASGFYVLWLGWQVTFSDWIPFPSSFSLKYNPQWTYRTPCSDKNQPFVQQNRYHMVAFDAQCTTRVRTDASSHNLCESLEEIDQPLKMTYKNFCFISSDLELPSSTPVALDPFEPKPLLTVDDCAHSEMLQHFNSPPPSILLENGQRFNITNGRANYR